MKILNTISYNKTCKNNGNSFFIDENKKINSITKEERRKLVNILKNMPITITGFRPIEEAIITAGGISIKEINPKTMESKIVSGLYFAGEIIDVDAYTGGFKLWSNRIVPIDIDS